MAGAAALKARMLGKGADDRQRLAACQREHIAVIFEQHHAFLCRLGGGDVMRLRGEGAFLGGGQMAENDAEYICNRAVDLLHGHFTVSVGIQQFRIAKTGGRRHLHIGAGLVCGDAVAHRVPVAHDIAVKSPFAAEQVGEEFLVLADIVPVYAVVGVHDRLHMRFAHRCFKRGQVDFIQCACRDICACREAARLLIVHAKMLGAGGDALALHAFDKACRHLAGQVWIL